VQGPGPLWSQRNFEFDGGPFAPGRSRPAVTNPISHGCRLGRILADSANPEGQQKNFETSPEEWLHCLRPEKKNVLKVQKMSSHGHFGQFLTNSILSNSLK
jgi:hypothetical protein